MTTPPPKSRALRGPLRSSKSKLWKRHPQDFYIEPQWCSERLFAVERFEGRVWDPACGTGRIVMSAQRAGYETIASDISYRGGFPGVTRADFLKMPDDASEPNIVCNPPFGIAEQFVPHALKLAERKVAMLLPANWVQGEKRSRWLQTTPLRRVYFLTPRPSMPPGPVLLKGLKPGNGTTDYAWFVWNRGYDGAPEIRWLRRDDGITSAHLGPEELARAKIKASGKLKSEKGLPLFTKRRAGKARDRESSHGLGRT